LLNTQTFRIAALLLPMLALLSGTAHAKLHTETVEYKDGDRALEGYLAYDDSGPAKKPGFLVVHDWMGVSAETKRRADLLAGLGDRPDHAHSPTLRYMEAPHIPRDAVKLLDHGGRLGNGWAKTEKPYLRN
jgi:hypothetical protein